MEITEEVYNTLARWLCYLLCLLLFTSCVTIKKDASVVLTEGPDTSAGDVPCYIISTPSATYYLEKEGGGLSSLLDFDGVDWIGFHPKEGSGSAGEYRGFPNAIFRQDGSYFHALNAGTQRSSSEVEIDSGKHVRIVFTSGNGKWKGRWDFYPDRCDFAMTEISPGFKYWVLYEGVPGGDLDKTDFWFSSADSERHSIDEKVNDDLPGPEWIAFGDVKSSRMIYILLHGDDDHPDIYYNMNDEMTVFGFGRARANSFLDTPQLFSIGFIESIDYHEVNRVIQGVVR